jgi:proteasome lid subunit RPN8/RPN11
MAGLRLTGSACSALDAVCAAAYPLEACGFLLGEGAWITGIAAVREAVQDRDSFEIPDHEVRRILAYARERGLGVRALFHSHPSGDNTLSAADRAALAYSAWPWVVVTREPELSGIRLTGYSAVDGVPFEVSE